MKKWEFTEKIVEHKCQRPESLYNILTRASSSFHFSNCKMTLVTSYGTPGFLGGIDRVKFAPCPVELNVLNQNKLVY